MSAEQLLWLNYLRMSALTSVELVDLTCRPLQSVAWRAFWEWCSLCSGRKHQVPLELCLCRKLQPFSLTLGTLAYVTHEDICKCFTGEEVVLHCKDVMLQSCQSVPAALLSQERVGSRLWAAQQHQVKCNVSSDAVLGLCTTEF